MPTVTRTRRHRLIRHLTSKIVEMHQAAGARDAHARVALGQLLLEVRTGLPHGEWRLWLEHDSPFNKTSAARVMVLAMWAAENPAVLARHAGLGPTKLYLLSRLAPAALKKLLARKRLAVPGSQKKKTLQLLTVAELQLAIGHLLGAAKPADAPPSPSKLFKDYKKRVMGLSDATRYLSNHHEGISAEKVGELHTVLLEAASRLAEAYDLG